MKKRQSPSQLPRFNNWSIILSVTAWKMLTEGTAETESSGWQNSGKNQTLHQMPMLQRLSERFLWMNAMKNQNCSVQTVLGLVYLKKIFTVMRHQLTAAHVSLAQSKCWRTETVNLRMTWGNTGIQSCGEQRLQNSTCLLISMTSLNASTRVTKGNMPMQERKVNQWTLGFVIEHEICIPNFGRHFLCVLEYIYKGIFQILQKELFFCCAKMQ